MLMRHWAAEVYVPLWQMRRAAPPSPTHPAPPSQLLLCDPLRGVPSGVAADVVLGLAGVVPGPGIDAAKLALNTDLALAAVEAAARTGAAHVFLSSSAAVYDPTAQTLDENAPTRPASAYGAAKLAMEQAALTRADELGVGACVLRIGNVAGADALLGPLSGTVPPPAVHLDRFFDGQGPRRSYIGPGALADVLGALARLAVSGQPLPERLNLALPGAVAMADLLDAAGHRFAWRPAPPQALSHMLLDVARLGTLLPLPLATPGAIVADWRADLARIDGAQTNGEHPAGKPA